MISNVSSSFLTNLDTEAVDRGGPREEIREAKSEAKSSGGC